MKRKVMANGNIQTIYTMEKPRPILKADTAKAVLLAGLKVLIK